MQLLKQPSQARIKEKANASVDLGSKAGKEVGQKGRRARKLHGDIPKEAAPRVKVG